RLAKAMLTVKRVTAQEQRFRVARLARFQAEGALLRGLVEAGIDTVARFRNEQPPELFEGDFGIDRRAHLLLAAGNLLVQTLVTQMGYQRDGERIGGGELKW